MGGHAGYGVAVVDLGDQMTVRFEKTYLSATPTILIGHLMWHQSLWDPLAISRVS